MENICFSGLKFKIIFYLLQALFLWLQPPAGGLELEQKESTLPRLRGPWLLHSSYFCLSSLWSPTQKKYIVRWCEVRRENQPEGCGWCSIGRRTGSRSPHRCIARPVRSKPWSDWRGWCSLYTCRPCWGPSGRTVWSCYHCWWSGFGPRRASVLSPSPSGPGHSYCENFGHGSWCGTSTDPWRRISLGHHRSRQQQTCLTQSNPETINFVPQHKLSYRSDSRPRWLSIC